MNFALHSIIDILQFIVIAIVLWLFYQRFIKNTSSERMIWGVAGLVGIWLLSWLFMVLKLRLLGEFTHLVAMFLSVGVIVVFQPELRKFFMIMGQVKLLKALFSKRALKDAEAKSKTAHFLDEIVKATEYMSRKHTGALMVLNYDFDGTIEILGTKIDAEVSSELILTIFFNKTPLHDGAMLLGSGRIQYAGAVLPLTQKVDLNWKYGTRHRAALGMSEATSAVILTVSEETGDISIAEHGKLTKFDDAKKLRAKLEKIMPIYE